MVDVKIIRDWRESAGSETIVSVDPDIMACILTQADKSDPMNRSAMVAARVGKRIGFRITVDLASDYRRGMRQIDEALSALAVCLVDNAAEIRDAIALEKAEG